MTPTSAPNSFASKDDEAIVSRALEGWRQGINQHRPQDIASFFTEDALFSGSHPTYSLGRAAVADYYSEPHAVGLSVRYDIREIRRLADGIVSAFVDPVFTKADGSELRFHLTVIVVRDHQNRSLISHYHVSRIP